MFRSLPKKDSQVHTATLIPSLSSIKISSRKKLHEDIPICFHPRDHSSPFSSQPNALAPSTAASESFNSDTISFVLPL